MRTNLSRWTLLAITVASIAAVAITGCKSGGYGWPSLAWWKKDSAANSLASRPGPHYPTPPSSNFSPRPTATAGTGVPTNPYHNPYLSGSTATGGQTSYPSTPYGGASYDNSASYTSGQNYSDSPSYSSGPAAPQKGYYSTNPPPPSNSGYTSGSDYGASGYGDYPNADSRNQYSPSGGSYQGSGSTTYGNSGAYPNSSGPYPTSSSPSSASGPYQPSSSGSSYGRDYPNTYTPTPPPSSGSGSALWNSGAANSSGPAESYSASGRDLANRDFLPSSSADRSGSTNQSYEPRRPSEDTSTIGARPSTASDLPSTLAHREGGYSPGSIGRSYNRLAGADQPLEGSRPSGSSGRTYSEIRRADYEQSHYDDQYPGGQPPIGNSLRSSGGSYLDNRS